MRVSFKCFNNQEEEKKTPEFIFSSISMRFALSNSLPSKTTSAPKPSFVVTIICWFFFLARFLLQSLLLSS